jgi:GNAT superfamily N-acetyltransferase
VPEKFAIRPVEPRDGQAVMELLRSSLGWTGDPRFQAFFEWKHYRNPFGPSAAWIALDADRVVGFRAMLRWDFQCGERRIRAVRPVDTATHPDYRGRGVFTRLTRHALDAMRDEEVELVFNTPNRASLVGYLRMGWHNLGRLQVRVRPTRPWRAVRMLGSRVAADRWPAHSRAGAPAAQVLADRDALSELLANRLHAPGLRTRLTPAFLDWRYGDPLLGYRAIVADEGPAAGVAIFRLRRRGHARELALCELLAHRRERTGIATLARKAVVAADADYVLRIASSASPGIGRWWSLPGQGPVLAARTLSEASPPPRRDWALTLGDIELL